MIFAAKDFPSVKLYISFDLSKHSINGKADYVLPKGKEVYIEKGNLILDSIKLGDKSIKPVIKDGTFSVIADKDSKLNISFEGRFSPASIKTSQGEALSQNVIDKMGICLVQGWFPAIKELAYYEISAIVPIDFEALAPSDDIEVKALKKSKIYRFIFPYPSESPAFVAAPYFIQTEKFNDIYISIYLLSKDKSLANLYLNKAKEFLNEYSQMIGPYPFKRFSVVENVLETGHAFPTFTLLGRKVIRFPFILKTSLPHEILHSWFGNCVYFNPSSGNWCEGLVTYLADHLQAEKKGEGAIYRQRIMMDYESYVKPQKDFSLKEFKSRFDKISQAIGYGKGAMVFHMLRKSLGNEHFFLGLKKFYQTYKFKQASWKDIQRVFEDVSSQDLSYFFDQWIERTGAACLNIKKELISKKNGNYHLIVNIFQGEPFYKIELPIKIMGPDLNINKKLTISKTDVHFTFELPSRPKAVIFDPEYDVFRRLKQDEFPPVLSRLFGAESGLIVVSKKEASIYQEVIDAFLKKGFLRISHSELDLKKVSDKDIIICGSSHPLVGGLFPDLKEEKSLVEVKENPYNPAHVIVIFLVESKIRHLFPRLWHYGKYQKVVFMDKEFKGTLPSYTSGIYLEISGPIFGLAFKQLNDLGSIIDAISLKQIIYVGEKHDEYSHHLAQLEIIKGLHQMGKKIAIGLEMFDRGLQQVIDDYLNRNIGEEEFLEKTQWLSRWSYDYHLYRPIIEYAYKNRLNIVALNADSETVKKVAREGLSSLDDKEREAIARELDFSNEAYKEWLKEVYEIHEDTEIKDFESFYQAQIIWDETMAETIVNFLKACPDYQMVVLAGNGHLLYGYGIPKRVMRRANISGTVIVSGEEHLSPEMADYGIFPGHKEPPFSARLGIILSEKKEGLLISSVIKGTPAKRAGLKKGDIIVSADGRAIKKVEDLKLILLLKKKGDKCNLKIKRKKKETEIDVGPF